ncbi:MAG: glycosyltransferase family 2 protein [Chitinophagales bacterium]
MESFRQPILLSIVSPVYLAEEMVDELVRQIIVAAEQVTPYFEIVLVEDGSPDHSWRKIEANCQKDKRVKGLRLSRNFGQYPAIMAGLKAAKGDYVVVMDCDLQDDPIYIPTLFEKAKKGDFDIVFTYAQQHNQSMMRRFTSKAYNALLKFLADYKGFDRHVRNYSIISRKVVNVLLQFSDEERHYLMVLRWLGFDYDLMEIKHKSRAEGGSSYSFAKLFQMAITGITYQSLKLLHFAIYIGLTLNIIAVGWGIAAFFAEGSLALGALMLFCTALILMAIGILGVYLGKVFNEVRNRPRFLVSETLNVAED